MKKKAIISLVLVAMLAFGIGAGSFAWFTSTATSANNVFAAGTLEIANPGDGVFSIGVAEVNNIYPTWTGSQTITVKNTGSLDFMYRLANITLKSFSAKNGVAQDILFNGTNGLEVSFDNTNWVKANAVANKDFGTIAANATKDNTATFTIYYRLPQDANNDYQGASATLNFNFLATQTQNTGWAISQ